MIARPASRVIDSLLREGARRIDGELLDRYVAHRDEAAFASLVRRHGPMVLSVCRRIVDDDHAADDAFQATFLVLVRRAAAVRPREAVANWLYGVAYRTALKARGTAAKRRFREQPTDKLPERVSPAGDNRRELRDVIDQELSRLPDKYRLPVVLCDLESRTQKEAAQQLGWLEGTLSGRLARARALLAQRLTRRGLTLSGAAIAAMASESAAAVSPALTASTCAAAKLFAAKQVVTGIVSTNALALTEGALRAMFFARIKHVFITVCLLSLVCAGAAAAAHVLTAEPNQDSGRPPPAAQSDPAKPAPPAQPKGEQPDALHERIQPGDRLVIQVTGTLPDNPIDGVYRVEPAGNVALGIRHGRLSIKGLTLEEAEAKIRKHLGAVLRSPAVQVTWYDPAAPVRGHGRDAALESRVRDLEQEVRALRAAVEELKKRQTP